MTKRKLTDGEKFAITFALWISGIALFAAALSLPMLPDRVSIFTRMAETSNSGQSKYYNLLLIFMSLIPAVVILLAAELKKRDRLKNNFFSIILFGIMLGLGMGCLIVYGIMRQLDGSGSVRPLNIHGLIAITASFFLSMSAVLFPVVSRAKKHPAGITSLARVIENYWQAGAYGFCLCAVAVSFTTGAFAYIPLAVFFAAYAIFLTIKIRIAKK